MLHLVSLVQPLDMKNQFDELEEFVRSNRADFDRLEPDPALWDRIQLPPAPPEQTSAASPWYSGLPFRVAAAVALLVALGIGISTQLQTNDMVAEQPATEQAPATDTAEAEMEGLIPELVEAEAFYAHQVNERLNELKAVNPEMEQEIRYDLAELDNAYNELKADLKEDLANRDIVEAMIQNYRIKLEVLEEILEQIKKSEDKTADNDTQDQLL